MIKNIREEELGIDSQSGVTYIPELRCTHTGCFHVMSFPKDIGAGTRMYHEVFFKLIDPEGPYKLSRQQAYEELGLKRPCCQLTLREPKTLSWESYDYDIRYASGKLDPSKDLPERSLAGGNSIASTIRGMSIISLNPENARESFPSISSSDSELALTVQNKSRVDPKSSIVIKPGTAVIGEASIGGKNTTVPIVSRHISLRDMRKK
jgi:hypothetical protein